MSATFPRAPAYPHRRGPHGTRLRRQWLLGVFGLVLVIIVGAAAGAVISVAPPPPEPQCPAHRPCGKPPRPAPDSPALLSGRVFTSPALGYRVEFAPRLWSVVGQNGTDLELQVNTDRATVILTIEGEASADSSQAALNDLMDRRTSELAADTVALSDDTDPRNAILGPSAGYRRGVGRILIGVTDTPQGPSSPVVVVVMAAGDGSVNVVVSLVTDKAAKKAAFDVADSVLNTFRFPSEVSS